MSEHHGPVLNSETVKEGEIPFLGNFTDRYHDSRKRLGRGGHGTVYSTRAKYDLLQREGIQGTLLERGRDFDTQRPMQKKKGLIALKFTKKAMNRPVKLSETHESHFISSIPPHDNLIQIYDIFISGSLVSGYVCYAMERMDSDLRSLIKAFRYSNHEMDFLRVVKSILSQLLKGINHIHQHGFMHCDLKPGNILVSAAESHDGKYDFVVKIADFDCALPLSKSDDFPLFIGTTSYNAPEIVLSQGFFTSAVDIWAFALIALEVSTYPHRQIFYHKERESLAKLFKVVLGTPNPHHGLGDQHTPIYGYWEKAVELYETMYDENSTTDNKEYPGTPIREFLVGPAYDCPELSEMITRCLQWDPERRPTAPRLLSMAFFEDSVDDDRRPMMTETPLPQSPNRQTHRNIVWSDSLSKMDTEETEDSEDFLPSTSYTTPENNFTEQHESPQESELGNTHAFVSLGATSNRLLQISFIALLLTGILAMHGNFSLPELLKCLLVN